MIEQKMPLAIYIHWPFCKSKCPYCDFNSHVSSNISHDLWLKNYLKAIDNNKDLIESSNITSIYFGGGTPSLMEPRVVAAIVDKINGINSIDNLEITLETNPTSFEFNKFVDFKNAGINRVSIGVQSFRDENLKFLGREHNLNEAQETLTKAASIFNNYSFDLIYGLPNQTLNDWENDLNHALKYASNHISLYMLTIEKGTRFYKDYLDGKFIMPDEDLTANFYEMTTRILEDNSFNSYEVSNYARSGFESRHNLAYWRYDDYLGIGPGAHSRISESNKIYAMHEYYSPNEWLDKMENTGYAVREKTEVLSKDAVIEMLLMNTRILEPIYVDKIFSRTGCKINDIINLKPLEEHGFIKIDDDNTSFVMQKSAMPIQNAVLNEILRLLDL